MYDKIIEALKQKMHDTTDERLNNMVSVGVLKLSDSQIATVSFVFWLVYLAETDLNEAITQAWNTSKAPFTSEIEAAAKEHMSKLLSSMDCSACGTPGKGRKIDVEHSQYFSDKIKIHEVLLGKTNRTKLLWKLNEIRNDLSHNRIDSLKYNGTSLSLRETREQILVDYLQTSFDANLSRAALWNSLPEKQQREIKSAVEEDLGG